MIPIYGKRNGGTEKLVFPILKIFFCLFMVKLVLCCCSQAFSSEQGHGSSEAGTSEGYSLVVVFGLFMAVASLVVENGL